MRTGNAMGLQETFGEPHRWGFSFSRDCRSLLDPSPGIAQIGRALDGQSLDQCLIGHNIHRLNKANNITIKVLGVTFFEEMLAETVSGRSIEKVAMDPAFVSVRSYEIAHEYGVTPYIKPKDNAVFRPHPMRRMSSSPRGSQRDGCPCITGGSRQSAPYTPRRRPSGMSSEDDFALAGGIRRCAETSCTTSE